MNHNRRVQFTFDERSEVPVDQLQKRGVGVLITEPSRNNHLIWTLANAWRGEIPVESPECPECGRPLNGRCVCD